MQGFPNAEIVESHCLSILVVLSGKEQNIMVDICNLKYFGFFHFVKVQARHPCFITNNPFKYIIWFCILTYLTVVIILL